MPALTRHLDSLLVRRQTSCLTRAFTSHSSFYRPLPSVTRIHDNVSHFIITSRTSDPYINLAVEDHLLRTSDPNTRILFTYVNRPCVVIGRNQNPWLEVNLAALRRAGIADLGPISGPTALDQYGSPRQAVELVRRRSGGGTVFHDEGNLNYSFIVPNDRDFHRNKHAEMVVKALHTVVSEKTISHDGEHLQLSPAIKAGIRVNERHDIVMPARRSESNGRVSTGNEGPEVKISGSAYKLTRGRALHHGTLLFSSPNLKRISHFLHSPAEGYIEAKGVESVRSPIDNLSFTDNLSVRQAIRRKIETSIADVFQNTYNTTNATASLTTIGESDLANINDPNNQDIKNRIAELQSQEWKYLQTPAFTLTFPPKQRSSKHDHSQTKNKNTATSKSFPSATKIHLQIKHGIITTSHISTSHGPHLAESQARQTGAALHGRKLHEVATDWRRIFAAHGSGDEVDTWIDGRDDGAVDALVTWLEEMIPSPSPSPALAYGSGSEL